MTIINLHVGVQNRNDMVYYFNGCLPFYQHRHDDRSSFKHVVCQMLSNHLATRAELSRAFQIPDRNINRWLSAFNEEGESCFYVKKK